MDEAARKVLKKQKFEIIRNLILNEDILDKLEADDILSEDMIQTIKAERTETDRILKLLFFLTRRGPNAFPAFISAIKPNFGFLAEKLQEEYDKESVIYSQALQKENPGLSNGSNKSSSVSLELLDDHDWNNVNVQNGSMVCPNCLCNIRIGPQNMADSSIQATQQNGTVSQNNQLENTKLTEYVNQNRELKTAANGIAHTDFMHKMLQEVMGCWYTKLKKHMTNINMRELSFKSPQPVTIEMVDELLDNLINTVEKCYRALNAKDRNSLLTHIIKMKESKKKLKDELKEKEEQRNKYCDNIMKLENKCRNFTEQIEVVLREKQKQNVEITHLKQQIDEKAKDIKDLNLQLSDAKSKLHWTQEKLHGAENEVENLTENMISYQREAETLKDRLEQSRRSKNSSTQSWNRYRQTPYKTEPQSSGLKAHTETIQSSIKITPNKVKPAINNSRSTVIVENRCGSTVMVEHKTECAQTYKSDDTQLENNINQKRSSDAEDVTDSSRLTGNTTPVTPVTMSPFNMTSTKAVENSVPEECDENRNGLMINNVHEKHAVVKDKAPAIKKRSRKTPIPETQRRVSFGGTKETPLSKHVVTECKIANGKAGIKKYADKSPKPLETLKICGNGTSNIASQNTSLSPKGK